MLSPHSFITAAPKSLSQGPGLIVLGTAWTIRDRGMHLVGDECIRLVDGWRGVSDIEWDVWVAEGLDRGLKGWMVMSQAGKLVSSAHGCWPCHLCAPISCTISDCALSLAASTQQTLAPQRYTGATASA